MRIISRHARYRVALDLKPSTWRERIAGWLRGLASRVDGRRSFALHIDCDPPIADREREDILKQGVAHMEWCLKETMREDFQEEVLRGVMPGLFVEDPVAPGKAD